MMLRASAYRGRRFRPWVAYSMMACLHEHMKPPFGSCTRCPVRNHKIRRFVHEHYVKKAHPRRAWRWKGDAHVARLQPHVSHYKTNRRRVRAHLSLHTNESHVISMCVYELEKEKKDGDVGRDDVVRPWRPPRTVAHEGLREESTSPLCAVGYLRAAVHEGVREESTMPLHATTTYPCAPLIPCEGGEGKSSEPVQEDGRDGITWEEEGWWPDLRPVET
jgi:hypothetical protein